MADDYQFKLAVCNELFETMDFAQQCRTLKKSGWQGIEIAPFTLQRDATTLPVERRREIRDVIQSEGLEFVGLHWLTVGPQGIHVTTPEEGMRRHSWDFVRRLADLCADLRGSQSGGVMVFGSPNQRKSTGGLPPEKAKQNYVDGLRSIVPHLEQRGVTLLVEALPMAHCDVITSLDEAAAVVRDMDSPAVKTMFDSHNAIDETEPHDTLVKRHWDLIRHIHVNELDGTYPRPDGGYDFKPVLQVAKDRRFGSWVSMEVFDFSPGADKIITAAMAYLSDQIAQLD